MVFCLFLHNNHFVIGIFELIYKLVRQKKRHSNLSCINPRQLADISRRPKQCTCQANIRWSSYMMIRFFFIGGWSSRSCYLSGIQSMNQKRQISVFVLQGGIEHWFRENIVLNFNIQHPNATETKPSEGICLLRSL